MGIFDQDLTVRENWFLERRGKMSASEIDKLRVEGKADKITGVKPMFGDGAMTYIKTKARECLTEYWENPALEFKDSLRHGKDVEQMAHEFYVKKTKNYKMGLCGTENPVFLHYDNPAYGDCNMQSGGSPDGLLFSSGGSIDLVEEIKCPFNPDVHFKNLFLKDQWDLQEEYPMYYGQCQFLLMITKAGMLHWVSFDERYTDEKHRMKIIEVSPDKKYQGMLEIKVLSAIKKKNEFIQLLKNAA